MSEIVIVAVVLVEMLILLYLVVTEEK